MTTKVAFIGLGVMGYPMAGHLAKSGLSLTVYNRTTAKARAWVDEYAGGRGGVRHTMGGFVKQHSREIDANADSRITLDELLSLASELFDKSDRQGAGRIVADPAIAPSNNPDYAPPSG